MLMTSNLFDYFEDGSTPGGAPAPLAPRAPRRPRRDYDLTLVARSPEWRDDAESLATLERVECEPWVGEVIRKGDAVRLRVRDDWIEMAGAALEAGGRGGGA